MRAAVIVSIVVCVFGSTAMAQDAKQVVGWLENAKILPENIVLPTRLDTVTESSSLEAEGLAESVKDGKKWVRFVTIQPDGTKTALEREVVRTAKVASSDGTGQERPVVRLGVCLGNQFAETEVILVDRGRFKQPLVLGRNFLVGRLVVDPADEFTVEPECMEGIRSGQREELRHHAAL
jgi:hypothetical protein